MLRVESVSKSFPGVKALDNVSVSFEAGKIHALLGENGAGKSTLLKILCGIYRPDDGSLYLDGKPVTLKSYHDAIKKNISIVHQEIQVVPLATVAENVMLDKLSRFKFGPLINWKELNKETRRYLDMVDLKIPETTVIKNLSAAQKQLVQIARALSSGARVLLLDEPTSSLTQHEASQLFTLLNKLKTSGVAILFVSHKLEEVLEISDSVSVLRDGKLIGTEETCCLDKDMIISMMIGRTVVVHFRGLLDRIEKEPVLELDHVGNKLFKDISLSLRKGEILGLYGLVGSGRTELAKTILGDYPIERGEIRVRGKKALIRSVSQALNEYRIGYVSENRKEEGLILNASVTTNVTITVWKSLAKKFGFLSPNIDLEKAQAMINRLSIKTPGPQYQVQTLSGGNQQKVSLAKWVLANCEILIVDEPTVGVDVGAKENIHDLIWHMAKEEGKAVLLISSDMPEMITLARRILVFKDFSIVGVLDNINDREYSYEEISARIGVFLA
jgi:ribose transport system ATP-binding protein